MFSKWEVWGRSIHGIELELSALKGGSHLGHALGKGQLSVKGKQSHVKPYMELQKFLISEFVAWLVLHMLFP